MKILFSGGGTLGPVTPLLALFEYLKSESEIKFVWVGTDHGPEEALVTGAGIRYLSLPASKFRRYFSWQTFLDIFIFAEAFFKSIALLRREKPDVCISAGGYVSVPLHYAARFLGIPTWIHQQDVLVGLANRLMTPVATLITVALEQSLEFFPAKKTIWLGNPVRASMLSGTKEEACNVFHLRNDLPVILATGGGTGSEKINMLIAQVALELDNHCQILHLTGKERQTLEPSIPLRNYHVVEFLGENMKYAYAAADIVVSRGGFGTLSEMAALEKAAVVIPKSGHQEKNVHFCVEGKGVIALNENTLNATELTDTLLSLLHHPDVRETLGKNLAELIPSASRESILNCLFKFSSQS